ncbi:MAG: hypothetical protein MRZ79_26620 [Bacteroidia bacterium]|nr:hypothetical protein [Bacteroidia bacterium]
MMKRILKFLSRGTWWQILSLILMIIAAWYFYTNYLKPSPPTGSTQKLMNLKEFESRIDSLNERFEFITLKKVLEPLIYEYSKPSYIVQITQKLDSAILSPYYFENSEYGIHSKNNQLNSFKLQEVCEVLEKINEPQNKNAKISQALKQIQTQVNFQVPNTLSFKVTNLHLPIWEMLVASQTITNFNVDSTKILVRGFADGSKGEWSKTLREKPYYYDSIKYSPVHPRDKGRDFPIYYTNAQEIHLIEDSIYINEDLPFLRANYIQDEYLSRVTGNCSADNPPEILLIEGMEFKDLVESSSQRRVEIIIQAYF